MMMNRGLAGSVRQAFQAQKLAPLRGCLSATVHSRSQSSFQHDRLVVEQTAAPKDKIQDVTQLGFGKYFSDHMLDCDWSSAEGWHAPRITPFQNLNLCPSSLVFHYGLECFEGMKAYRGLDGECRLFRPEMNVARLNKSASRLALPTVEPEDFIKCLKDLIRLDQDWIPEGLGYSMYMRPTMIATEPVLGVGKSNNAKLFVLLSPVGAYYSGGFKPVRLLADNKYVRAWPGGMGDTKSGGNYGPTIMPQKEAQDQGFDQVLWLFGDDHQVTEVGTMNLFAHWINEDGVEELVTAPLDGTILAGVTRQSVLDLANEWGQLTVSERTFTMPELQAAIQDGRVKEIFGSGTAATISPVAEIVYNGVSLKVPTAETQEDSSFLSNRVSETIFDIQYGRIEDHPWAPKL